MWCRCGCCSSPDVALRVACHHSPAATHASDRTYQPTTAEECGNPIATVKYLPNGANGQGEYITTDCQPAKWDCSSPDYVLDGTSYWSLGDSEANDDKRSCADGPVDD